MNILQVTPTHFADRSVVGGGERYVSYVCKAVEAAADRDGGLRARSDMLSFAAAPETVRVTPGTTLHLLPGTPDDLASIATPALDDILAAHDVVHVHQCLSGFGLFVGGRAKLHRKVVVGTDHGGGEAALLQSYPRLTDVFDLFHAQSDFAGLAFLDFAVPTAVIKGPVDDLAFRPDAAVEPDASRVVAIGRVLPHKGYEAVIDALPGGLSLVVVGRTYDAAYKEYLVGKARGKRVTFEEEIGDAALHELVCSAGLCTHTSVHFGHDGAFYHKPELLALAPLECMSAGRPVLTSRAGALRELEGLAGCRTYARGEQLAALLRSYAAGTLALPAPAAIREDVVAKYGLRRFGAAYLAALEELVHRAHPDRQ